jgi:hypothetical protein
MHKRLTGNLADELADYDIARDPVWYDTNNFQIKRPLSNFAKSGTSDDILTPYNSDPQQGKMTNYCLWNAVIRITLEKSASVNGPETIFRGTMPLLADSLDITIACIGEGNKRNTGFQDGKTLHKFLTSGLLNKFGSKTGNGFFKDYEQYLTDTTPESIKFYNPYEGPNLSPALKAFIDSLAGPELTGTVSVFEKKLLRGIYLSKDAFGSLAVLSRYMGNQADTYITLLKQMTEPQSKNDLSAKINSLAEMTTANRYLDRRLDENVIRLRNSLQKL